MNKSLIGALVGGIILFLWQFLSWGVAVFHANEMKYTENQDEILEFLDGKLEPGSGTYFLPRVPKGTSAEDMKAATEAAQGKNWALISYRSDLQMGMGLNMVRGFVIDFVAVLLLCWVLLQFAELTMGKTIMASVAIGIIGYLTISYLNSIWFEYGTWGALIDAIGSWLLVGLWLGWWLRR